MANNNTAQDYSQDQSNIYKLLSMQRAQELEASYVKTIGNTSPELPTGFFVSGNKLMYSSPKKTAKKDSNDEAENAPNQETETAIYIGPKIEVSAYARDENNENYGKLLIFTDPEGIVHKWILPLEHLVGEGGKYKAALLKQGYEMSMMKQAQYLLSVFLAGSRPERRIRLVSQLGWYKSGYILVGEVLGNADGEELFFQPQQDISVNHAQKGTLQDWISNVAKLCIGNSRLEFALSCAFAAPLLHLLEIESGGFHLRGTTSKGKSKILQAAASVWGGIDDLQRWNATLNGLEALASGYNDSLLCLDEIAQMNSDTVGESAYLLANGRGKFRANKFGFSRGRTEWRLLFLSNGEISLAEHAMQCGKKVKAGQEIRILDIPAVTGKYGCFDELHGYGSGEGFADRITEASSKYYGTASRAYINSIIRDPEFAKHFSISILKKFTEKHMPLNACSQVARALKRFSIVAAGGELATAYGITGWDAGTAAYSTAKCFTDWLSAWEGADDPEEVQILKRVYNFFILHGKDKFESWDTKMDLEAAEKASFRKTNHQGGTEFFVHKLLFEKEICSGIKPADLAQLCIKHGLILPDAQGNSTRSETASINKIKARYYRFTSKVLEMNF